MVVLSLAAATVALLAACSSGTSGQSGTQAPTQAPSPEPTTQTVATAAASPTVAVTPVATATPGPLYHSIAASELTPRDEGKPLLPVARAADIVSLKFPPTGVRGQYAGLVLAGGARIVSPINGTVTALRDFTAGSFGAYRYVQITPDSGAIAELIVAPDSSLASDIAVGSRVTRGATVIGVYGGGRLGGVWSDYSMLLSLFPAELAVPDLWATGLPAILRSGP
jgi:hypothetical protein